LNIDLDFDPNVDDKFMPNGLVELILAAEQQNLSIFVGGNIAHVKKFSICYSKILPT